ncbi:MAG TPA: hypothetical protein VFD88_12815 [Clostridia bacterium]|nr:hypothetical protein [Clostridia bacterium]
MIRYRVPIVIGILVVFAAVIAFLISHNSGSGGQNVTVNLSVTHADSLTPPEATIHQNDTVTINITSDTTGEVHLHGYDIPFNTVAGQVVSHTFKAVNSGKFELEWESTSTHLGYLIVNP